MKLDRLEVSGFRSIRHTSLEFGALNVLIGANGSGKSNLVGVFGLLQAIVERRLEMDVRKRGGASRLLHHGPKRTPRLRVRAKFGPNAYEVELEPSDDDQWVFASEVASYHRPPHPHPYDEAMGRGHAESRLADVADTKPVAAFVLKALRSWRVFHFHDTSSSAAVKRPCPLGDNAFLRADAANLAAWLYRIQREQRTVYTRIVSAVQQVAPFFRDFQLRPDPVNPDSIRLEWTERDSDAYFTASQLSDGTLRFICLATLLLQSELPSMVLIDEPELGLHPYAIVQLAALMRAASTRTQLLVATQSVTLVNQLEPEDLIIAERLDGASTFRRPTSADVAAWLDDYSLGELWEKNVLGGRPSAT